MSDFLCPGWRCPVPLVLVTVAALATGAVAQEDTAPPLPPPGRLVDVGGWRLHLHCTGVQGPGQPIVILEAGVGDFSVEWSLVQPGVAGFARVCLYDRAGDGWSELGPHPRTMRQVVYELHTLLEKAGERPTFVLVGHSYGGWLVGRPRIHGPPVSYGKVDRRRDSHGLRDGLQRLRILKR